MQIPLFSFVILLGLLLPNAVAAEEVLVVRHYQYDNRYKFGSQVLELALKKLNVPYDIQKPNEQLVNEKRGEQQVIDGRLDVEWMSTTHNREKLMIPIRIPIYRGLLGLRLLLVKPIMHPHVSKIERLEDLQQYTGGHGTHWGDLVTYEANELKVDHSVSYQALFKKLISGRFDYMHRGLSEIWDEQERHIDQLIVADNIMIFYPHPVYFFVSKHNPGLAQKISFGLSEAIKDGSYKSLFMEHFAGDIRYGDLGNRRLIVLENPATPEKSKLLDTSWWMPEKHLKHLLSNR